MASLVALYSQGRWKQGADWVETLLHVSRMAKCFTMSRARSRPPAPFERAVALYDIAIALAPDYFEALNNRGNALRELGRATDALASFDAALRLNPAYARPM